MSTPIAAQAPFKPALVVVDAQEDFCPPNGSLAVPGGRDIAPTVNDLLALHFPLKIATKDFHPVDHISFSTSHGPPNNKAFESFVSITNPENSSETIKTAVWPVHCVQGTSGCDIIPEINAGEFDVVVEKGMSQGVEMYSAFADAFGNKSRAAASLDLAALLRSHSITHIYIVGLAGDYCVSCTALDARKEGLGVLVVEEGTRSVNDGGDGWGAAKEAFLSTGVQIVSMDSPELARVRDIGSM